MTSKPKVAVIGTGGTITSIGKGPLDLYEYTATGKMLQADEMVEKFSDVKSVADVIPVRFKAVPSTAVAFPEWKHVVLAADKTVAEHPDLAGIVVLHGTATLEETAYALHLTAKVKVPIVVRLTGTNEAEGREILKTTSLIPAETMQDAAAQIVQLAYQ